MSITHLSAAQKLLFLLLVLMLSIVFAEKAHAAAYMKLGDIKGNVTSSDHKDWINLDSVSLPTSLSTAVSAAPEGAKTDVSAGVDEASTRYSSKRQHKPMSITKPVDKSSASLQKAAQEGKVFKQATLDTVDPKDPAQPVRYELENVMISSYQISGSAGSSAQPMESFSLNFEEIKVIKLPKAKKSR